jgi:hypothetical protein
LDPLIKSTRVIYYRSKQLKIAMVVGDRWQIRYARTRMCTAKSLRSTTHAQFCVSIPILTKYTHTPTPLRVSFAMGSGFLQRRLPSIKIGKAYNRRGQISNGTYTPPLNYPLNSQKISAYVVDFIDWRRGRDYPASPFRVRLPAAILPILPCREAPNYLLLISDWTNECRRRGGPHHTAQLATKQFRSAFFVFYKFWFLLHRWQKSSRHRLIDTSA